jgi:hypothetical protein
VGDVDACCCCSFAPELVSAQLSMPMLEHMRDQPMVTSPYHRRIRMRITRTPLKDEHSTTQAANGKTTDFYGFNPSL